MRVLTRGGGRLLLAGAGLLMLLSLTPVGAATANLSRSFTATEPIQNGSLVSLDSGKPGQVQPANNDNGSRLIGVALASDDSLIAVDPASGKVQVATSGIADALVSTLGGPIKVGDTVGVSPFSGIGMKAQPGFRVIGLAQNDFSKDSQGSIQRTVMDKAGKKNQLTVGYIRVSIAIGTDGSISKDAQLNGLQRLVQGLTGRTVPTFRVITSLIIALVALLILVTLIYAAIYGSVISIGRNPLAKYAVFRTLGAVIGIALLTAGLAALSIFLLLR